MIVISAAAPSTMAASTTWPLPERARSTSAQAMPKASSMPPPPKSPTRLSGGSGASPRRPIECERAGERDVVDVVAGRLRERTLLAPARHAAVDEARIAREADVGAEAEPLHHAGPEALDQRVGLLDQTQHRVDALGLLQVDADRAPAARQEVEARLARDRRRCTLWARSTRSTSAPMSASIIAGEGPGADARDLDDANSIQRSHVWLLSSLTDGEGPGG